MKKIIASLCLIPMLICSQALSAAPMDEEKAIEIADRFLFNGEKKLLRNYARHVLTHEQLFLINYSQDGRPVGFAVVANEDNMPSPVLAFSTEGRISPNNSTIRSILQQYNNEIKEWRKGKSRSAAADPSVRYQKSKPSCPPLLKKDLWHQGFPYNQPMPRDADSKRSLVGCAAIAMAKIMRYYEHPKRGTGTGSYSKPTKKGKDFSATTCYDSLSIDWKAIADSYTPQDSAAAAFCDNPFLKEISLSDKVKSLSPYTFSHCPELSKVKFPEGLEQMPPNSFNKCPKLSPGSFPERFRPSEKP